METVNRNHNINKTSVNAMIIVFFAMLFLIGGYGPAGDSESYLTLNIYREPVYSLIVCGLNSLFEQPVMYVVLAFIQNVIAAFSVIILVSNLDRFVLKDNLSLWISAVIAIVPFAMTPVLSRSHLVTTNKIMEEALTIPEYYLFVAGIVAIIFDVDNRKKHIFRTSLVTVLLVLTRGQMSIVIIGYTILLLIIAITEKKMRVAISAIIIGLGLFAVTGIATRTYNYLCSGEFCGTVSGKTTFLSNVLYVSEEKDGELIEDSDLSSLFYSLHEKLDENRLLYDYAEGSIADKGEYHEFCHDAIKYDYFEPVKNEVFTGRMGDTYDEYLIFQDEIAGQLSGPLLKGCFGRWIKNYLAVALLGFIRTVAIDRGLLRIYAVLIYGAYAALLILNIKKRGLSKRNLFAVFVLIMIIGFCLGTAIYIMCLSRYVIYNLPFFYISLYMLIRDMFLSKRDAVQNC